MITAFYFDIGKYGYFDYRGGGDKISQKYDYEICERSLSLLARKAHLYQFATTLHLLWDQRITYFRCQSPTKFMWPEATTFEKLHRGYLQQEGDTDRFCLKLQL